MTVARTAVPETPASNASATAAMATDAARREPAAPIAESRPARPGGAGPVRPDARHGVPDRHASFVRNTYQSRSKAPGG